MGVNAAGLFAGLTNRPAESRDERRRSRGLLVMDALGSRDVAEVEAGLGGDPHRRYNPFFLLSADGRRCSLASVSETFTRVRALEPGVHVVGNEDPSDPGSDKITRIRSDVERKIDPQESFEALFAGLVEILGGHELDSDPFRNTCVHTPDYGTRSAAVLALGPRARGYWASEGPPCKTKFNDYTSLLDALPQA